MTGLFHVTSALNPDSILAHGLDWTRMGAAPGLASDGDRAGRGAGQHVLPRTCRDRR